MGAETGEAKCECLPDAAHGGQMEAFSGGLGEIVEIDAAGKAKPAERFLEPAGAGKEGRVHPGRE
jgi:hypothetical protein